MRAALAVGIGFESVQDTAVGWSAMARRFEAAGVGGFSIAVGRPEWTAFPWAGREAFWAPRVAPGHDRIEMVLDRLSPDRSGVITLTVDVLSPARISDAPEIAGSFSDGTVSSEFPSATALHRGSLGEEVVELCAEIAERYRPHRIALTELIGDTFFADADEELFAEMTGGEGFPREERSIRIDDPAVTAWQSAIITGLLSRCQEAVAPFGTAIEMDARVDWEAPGQDRPDSGHLYDEILGIDAHLMLWAYAGLSGVDPMRTVDLADAIEQRFDPEQRARTAISVGLWGAAEQPISPPDLATAIDGAARGVSSVLVTPLSLMSEEHWRALPDLSGW